MLNSLVRCLPTSATHILELGCGTGELSLKVLRHCPQAQLMAIDYSPRMLKFAQDKFQTAGYGDRAHVVEADFGAWASEELSLPLDQAFDACISSLAIHHLADDIKLKLFRRIRQVLQPGGCFWNADPVLPESPQLADTYKAVREEWAAQQGTTLAEVRAGIGTSCPQGYSDHDRLASLTDHLQMLQQAGFETVAVPWKYYGMALFGGWATETS